MRNALFIAFLLVALAYALRRGGGPERAMAGIAAAMVISDQLLHLMIPLEFGGLDTGHLAIDLAGAGATFLLAMIAHRFWPMMAVKRRSKGTPYRRRRGTPFSDMMLVS